MGPTAGVEACSKQSDKRGVDMKRWTFFLYGLASYGLFFALYAYFCAFTAGVLVPRTIDAPVTAAPPVAAAIDVALLLAFGLQHSVMARPGFKRVWTRFVPTPIERSTYVVASCVVLGLMIWLWQPIDAVIWEVDHPLGQAALWALFVAGWLMVPAVTFMINHFDLFGMRQVWLHARGHEYQSLAFRTPMLYAHMRHPLYVGWALAFWATPKMTAGHLLFAVVLTGYMALATVVEERDLVAHFGQQYEAYRRAVPRFVPRLARRAGAPAPPPALEPGADNVV
jgi:protein-S-isoprenylcysteine O-methyltransferase Ste14